MPRLLRRQPPRGPLLRRDGLPVVAAATAASTTYKTATRTQNIGPSQAAGYSGRII